MDIKPYKKDFDYSYSLGAFPTIELIKARPEDVICVFIHSTFTDAEKVRALCEESGISVSINDKLINRLSDKENVFCVGVFRKFDSPLANGRPHVLLVNPGNMGNMGTIIRTCVGFGIMDLAVITPGADFFNPKTIRASMGSAFRLRHGFYSCIEEYLAAFPDHRMYSFMLDSSVKLRDVLDEKPALYTLAFGNEATGLPHEFSTLGTPVFIPQTELVDSLNITIAAAIAIYTFAN